MQLIPRDWRSGDYSVSYNYDKNSNLEEAERQGWAYVDEDGNDVYDTVDDVLVTYDGNQRKSVTSNTVSEEDYYGKMTFVDGADKGVEYAYDGNGNLTRDDNKGITNIEYDLLGNPRKVTLKNYRSIEYVYAADGRKLRTIHERSYTRIITPQPGHGRLPGRRTEYICDTTDYINNYIFKDGKPEMFRFDGGYYSFDDEGKMDGCHLYVQDYQGNNRMVVNAYTNEVEQISHYYPYGALMGDISTQPEAQDFKYSGKELDRTFGLDLYDFHARQYDPLLPGFNAVDPCATDYYWISPYVYCAGNPVNCVDKDGKRINGVNNEFVSIDTENWTIQNANEATNKLWNIAKNTDVGRKYFQAAIEDPTIISISVSEEIETRKGTFVNGKTAFGKD
jgi:RHS repeat-associated protein